MTMAKSAVTQLQDQIETIRKEAFDEGYKAAMQAVRELAGRPAEATNTSTKRPTKAAPARKQTRRVRGANAAVIAEVLKALPKSTGRAADIKRSLKGKGKDLPFTSIGHALGQLQARGQATVAEDSKTWTYTGA
jgi:hypothetical protein